MKYKVSPYYICDGHEGVALEYEVRALSPESALYRAMALFRRTFLGGDLYRKLKESRAHLRRPKELVWENFDGGTCSVSFDQVEEHG